MFSKCVVHRCYRLLQHSIPTNSMLYMEKLLAVREHRSLASVLEDVMSTPGKELQFSDIDACITEAISNKQTMFQDLSSLFDVFEERGISLSPKHIGKAMLSLKELSGCSPLALRILHYCHNNGIVIADSQVIFCMRLCLLSRDLEGLMAIPQRDFMQPEFMELSYGYSLELCRRKGDTATALRLFDEMSLNKVPVSSRHFSAIAELFPKEYINAIKNGNVAAWIPPVSIEVKEHHIAIKESKNSSELRQVVSIMYEKDIVMSSQIYVSLIDKCLSLNDVKSAQYWYNSLTQIATPPPETMFSIMSYAVGSNDIFLAESIIDVSYSEACFSGRIFQKLVDEIIKLYEHNNMTSDISSIRELPQSYILNKVRKKDQLEGRRVSLAAAEQIHDPV